MSRGVEQRVHSFVIVVVDVRERKVRVEMRMISGCVEVVWKIG
jgi:hypothetical protein